MVGDGHLHNHFVFIFVRRSAKDTVPLNVHTSEIII